MSDRLQVPDRLRFLLRSLDDLEHKFPSDEFILDGPEFRALIGISRPTEWRMHKAGDLPARVQLTTTRYGYRWGHIKRWIAARTEQSPLNKEVARGEANTTGHETQG